MDVLYYVAYSYLRKDVWGEVSKKVPGSSMHMGGAY